MDGFGAATADIGASDSSPDVEDVPAAADVDPSPAEDPDTEISTQPVETVAEAAEEPGPDATAADGIPEAGDGLPV